MPLTAKLLILAIAAQVLLSIVILLLMGRERVVGVRHYLAHRVGEQKRKSRHGPQWTLAPAFRFTGASRGARPD